MAYTTQITLWDIYFKKWCQETASAFHFDKYRRIRNYAKKKYIYDNIISIKLLSIHSKFRTISKNRTSLQKLQTSWLHFAHIVRRLRTVKTVWKFLAKYILKRNFWSSLPICDGCSECVIPLAETKHQSTVPWMKCILHSTTAISTNKGDREEWTSSNQLLKKLHALAHISFFYFSQSLLLYKRNEMPCFAVLLTTWASDEKVSIFSFYLQISGLRYLPHLCIKAVLNVT